MDLSVKFDCLVLKNPLMPAAGPLVGDAEKMLWLNHVAGCGAIVAKTISTQMAHIPHPCIVGDNNAIYNCELLHSNLFQLLNHDDWRLWSNNFFFSSLVKLS